ncbi:hypothetical protein HD554DRAFT_2114547 [Boletus coccyginus]|nr:hypothetical protein HD554DRAFT_2114547 [Boletus coccyginus]
MIAHTVGFATLLGLPLSFSRASWCRSLCWAEIRSQACNKLMVVRHCLILSNPKLVTTIVCPLISFLNNVCPPARLTRTFELNIYSLC